MVPVFGSLLALDPQVKATSASPSRHSGSVTGGSKKHETMPRSLKLDPQVKATSALLLPLFWALAVLLTVGGYC